MMSVLPVLSGLTVLRNTTGVVVDVTSQNPASGPVVISVAPETTMMLSAAMPRAKPSLTAWVENSKSASVMCSLKVTE